MTFRDGYLLSGNVSDMLRMRNWDSLSMVNSATFMREIPGNGSCMTASIGIMQCYLSGNNFSELQCRLTYQLSVVLTKTYSHKALTGARNSLPGAEVRYLHKDSEEYSRAKHFLTDNPVSTLHQRR